MERKTVSPFSDEELEIFRLKIVEIQQNANNNISMYQQLEEREEVKGSDRAINTCLDNNSIVSTRAIKRAKETLDECDKALNRIKNKRFGFCSRTGEVIPKEKLSKNPLLTENIIGK